MGVGHAGQAHSSLTSSTRGVYTFEGPVLPCWHFPAAFARVPFNARYRGHNHAKQANPANVSQQNT